MCLNIATKMKIINKGNLNINSALFDFINNEVIPETGINLENFWKNFDKTVHELAPINKKLIENREEIQRKIDSWHIAKKMKNLKKKST